MNLLGLLSSGATGFTISTLLTAIGDIFEAFMGMVGDVVTMVGSQPIFIFVIAVSFAPVGIHFFKMILNAGKGARS